MSFSKAVLLFLSFLASVTALATPHAPRAIHHRALAGRIALPEPVDVFPAPVRRRQNGKRCRPRPSSPAVAQPTSTKVTDTTKAPPTHTAPPPTTHRPSPTTTKEHPPATTKKPSSPSSNNLPSFMVGTQIGQGTFYETGLTACGVTNTDSEHIAAVSHLLFDVFPGYNRANPNNNPICGRKVTAHYQGKSVTVAITDRCTGCALTDLDFSPSAFRELADFSLGRLDGVKWEWV